MVSTSPRFFRCIIFASLVLFTRVALAESPTPLCGDVNDSSSLTASDALLVLRKSVGQPISLSCAAYEDQFQTCEAAAEACESELLACHDGQVCGNGTIDDGEDCDLGAPGAATCSSATDGAKPYGLVGCTNACAFDTSACTAGTVVGGVQWFKGTAGASCEATCAANSLVYDTATLTYAGSGGTDEHCIVVATALGFSNFEGTTSTTYGLGCVGLTTSPGGFFRDTNPTFSNTGAPTGLRLCACH